MQNGTMVDIRQPFKVQHINNTRISVATSLILMHTHLLILTGITEEAMQGIGRAENIICYASLISRLTNDLATSADEQEIGDVPTSIQYIHGSGATECVLNIIARVGHFSYGLGYPDMMKSHVLSLLVNPIHGVLQS